MIYNKYDNTISVMEKRNFLLAGTGLIPLLGLINPKPDLMLPVYSVFVLVYFLREKIVSFSKILPLKGNLKIAYLILLAGLFGEFLAWSGNYAAHRNPPILFHPQLFYDLVISLAQYGSWAIVWVIILRRFKFSLLQVFIIHGLSGVLIEQQFQIFIKGLLSMPLGLLMWLYVFTVYGSIMGISYVFFRNELNDKNKSDSWIKYPLLLILILVIGIIFFLVWGGLLDKLGFIPKPVPIWERPFF